MNTVIVIEVRGEYQPEDGDHFDAVTSAIEHFHIHATLQQVRGFVGIDDLIRSAKAEIKYREALRECMGAISELQAQVNQMRSSFNDDDGTIATAMQDGDEAYKHAREALRQ